MCGSSDSFKSLRYAVRALRSEFLEFRFDYPIPECAETVEVPRYGKG
jgi:hypothetical protein